MKAQLRQEVIKSQAIINTLAKDVCASIPHLADFFIHLPSFTEEWKKVAATEGPDLLGELVPRNCWSIVATNHVHTSTQYPFRA